MSKGRDQVWPGFLRNVGLLIILPAVAAFIFRDARTWPLTMVWAYGLFFTPLLALWWGWFAALVAKGEATIGAKTPYAWLIAVWLPGLVLSGLAYAAFFIDGTDGLKGIFFMSLGLPAASLVYSAWALLPAKDHAKQL
jgi:hypothetical protein